MRQEELRAQNKQRVLEEALKCFYYDGIERTKVATIAQKAGVTSMSVYRYYGDKEKIVLETAALFWNKFVDDMTASLNALNFEGRNGLERLGMIIKAYVGTYRQNIQALLLMQEFDMYIYNRKHLEGRERISECYERMGKPVTDAFAMGLTDSSIDKSSDKDEICCLLLNATFGALQKLAVNSQSLFFEKVCSSARQMDLFCDMMISYIKS